MRQQDNVVRLLVSTLILISAGAAEEPIYVTPVGADAVAALTAARDHARRLPAGAAKRIVLRAGSYYLSEPVVFTDRDSGLSLEAAPGAVVTLYGGRRISGWKPDGPRFWAVQFPPEAALPDARMLAVNGRFAPLARLPETGYFRHLSRFKVRWLSTSEGGWERKPTPEEMTTLKFRPQDLTPLPDINNAEIRIYHRWDESRLRVRSIDPVAGTLVFAGPGEYPPGAFDVYNYLVMNTREGMKHPGQWYLDRTARKLVYWPLPGEDMAAAEVLLPSVRSILRFEGTAKAPVRDVTVRGLRLAVTNTPPIPGGFAASKFDGAIALSEAANCTLRDLEIFNVAGQGIRTDHHSKLRILNSSVHDTGAAGLQLNGSETEVADTRIHDAGLLYPSAPGLQLSGPRGHIHHTEVHDTPYSGMIVSGDDQLIEHNRIYRNMQELDDGGGIYLTSSKRSILRGNFVHDMRYTGGSGASAYYLDEKSEDCLVEGNLSVDVTRPSLTHMGRNNTLRGNVFVTHGDARIDLPRSSGLLFEKNVVYAGGAITFHQPPGGIAAMPDNVIFSARQAVTVEYLDQYVTARTGPLEAREGTVLADPQFADPEHGDFRFRPGSPALALGIKPPDVGGAGPRPGR